MNLPLISVIVPIYKVEKYLCKCVDSLINQTYKNLEIILVDDGSPDNCPQICDDYSKKDSRIKVIHKENGGLSDARNAGMKIATGEYISFIDSDDWVETQMIEKMFTCINKDKSDVVSSGVKWVKDDGSLINDVTVDEDGILDTVTGMKELLKDGLLKQHVWNKLYKASLISNIPYEKGKYHEDVFWSYQVFGIAEKTSVMKDSFYNYVQRKGSIMGEDYSSKRLDALDAMKLRCDYMKEKFPDLYNLALNIYIGSCMYHMQLALKAKSNKDIINNIKRRVNYYKNGDVLECISGKQKFWIKLFVKKPVLTSKARNFLKVGM